jgi:hypothetical protein
MDGRFGGSSAFSSRVTALPPAASPLTAPEAQLPTTTAVSSAPAASGPGFLELMIAFTDSIPQNRDPAPPDAPPKEKKPRPAEEAIISPTPISNLQVFNEPPVAAALEFALGRPVESHATELVEQTPQPCAQAGLPARGPDAVLPRARAAGTPLRAEPIENDQPGKVAPAASGEIGPDAALSRLAMVPTAPAAQTDAVPHAEMDAVPIRPEPERRPPAPIDAPQASVDRVAPPQTAPEETLAQSLASTAMPVPGDQQAPPTRAARQPVIRQESTALPRTQTAFGARLVPTQPRPQRVTAESAASQTEHQQAAPDDPPEKRRAARLLTDDTGEEQATAARSQTFVPFSREVQAANGDSSTEPRTPEPAAAPRGEKVATTPDNSKAPPIARDIKLELSGADRKVEVRLVERAGEVHFAVRTLDGRLAGALREQLPALSSRLEQSGFRAEGWHASSDSGPERRLDVASSGNTSNDDRQTGGRQNGQERREQDQPRPRHAEELIDNKPKGQQFEWLFSSLR